MMKRGVYTHFGTKMNGIFSSYLDKKSPRKVLDLSVEGFRGPNLAKIMKMMMGNDEREVYTHFGTKMN
jgi:hypothetical protein